VIMEDQLREARHGRGVDARRDQRDRVPTNPALGP
jgi:hypothetical protein